MVFSLFFFRFFINNSIILLFLVLEYLHERGIVHTDIKLDNLLLDENYQIKISDFGYGVSNVN